MNFDPFYSETDEKLIRVQTLGRIISRMNRVQFEQLIRISIKSGIVDVTGWTVEGVKALLTVCAEDNLRITLKDDTRYFMPVRYPKGPLLESLAVAIVTGEW
jgi:1,4-dihydroxy-2-naphthoyl-CoA synthase